MSKNEGQIKKLSDQEQKPQFFLVQPEAMVQIMGLLKSFPLPYPDSSVRDNMMNYLAQLKPVGVTEGEISGKT